MTRLSTFFSLFLVLLRATTAFAQAPAKDPTPLWDAQAGASFIGTGGNSDTSSTGIDFGAHRRGEVWKIDSTATAVHTADHGVDTAERYLGAIRGQRVLTQTIGVSAGERIEHDTFAGINVRSILDGGLSWVLVKQDDWTLDGITGLAWNHEARTIGTEVDDPVGVFQLLSRVPFGAAGDTTERVTFYPDFRASSAYRNEIELTAQASMNSRLALKIGYLYRFSHDPVPGFKKSDNTTTASVVLRWKAATPAP